ncbi:class I SAM-dependent methyltransferase [Mesobacillus subterraneus]|uniref:Methyltransferase domain-containing protein n=1 Tax=Mesobacillus subterraneus TaxID=285983 RepID=A0A3R9KVT9_9BACI|nr:methyltransferase domain-containing protein [Mesobacillus subterraneus]RSD27347.1 methyltransferase domain-containing protein [Mesobacillus subterraneus]
MNNSWNKVIYKGWAPIYDVIFNAGPFARAREKLFQEIAFQPGDRVLFVGVGTGADIERVPYPNLDVTAIDYSEYMLEKARDKFKNSQIEFVQMDAQKLSFPAESFDYVVASLILSIVPDSKMAYSEIARVCRTGGNVLIFDKFAEPGKGLAPGKKAIRHIVSFFGTDIGRSFEEIHEEQRAELRLLSDNGIMFGNMYRRILLEKI